VGVRRKEWLSRATPHAEIIFAGPLPIIGEFDSPEAKHPKGLPGKEAGLGIERDAKTPVSQLGQFSTRGPRDKKEPIRMVCGIFLIAPNGGPCTGHAGTQGKPGMDEFQLKVAVQEARLIDGFVGGPSPFDNAHVGCGFTLESELDEIRQGPADGEIVLGQRLLGAALVVGEDEPAHLSRGAPLPVYFVPQPVVNIAFKIETEIDAIECRRGIGKRGVEIEEIAVGHKTDTDLRNAANAAGFCK